MENISIQTAPLTPEGRRELLGRLLRQKVGKPKTAPLSFGQLRLWFLDELEPGSIAYNIASGVRLLGRLNPLALERSLQEIIRRHEVLRTTFFTVDGVPAQRIAPTFEFHLEI